ncbi:MAG: hypothetical protein PCFJNLEI_03585 [Verrucomicrobiae bacterium]|nr:hypothetical protein [Verrucomicrobiae bacterium]
MMAITSNATPIHQYDVNAPLIPINTRVGNGIVVCISLNIVTNRGTMNVMKKMIAPNPATTTMTG